MKKEKQSSGSQEKLAVGASLKKNDRWSQKVDIYKCVKSLSASLQSHYDIYPHSL
jgi:hypothetical protein